MPSPFKPACMVLLAVVLCSCGREERRPAGDAAVEDAGNDSTDELAIEGVRWDAVPGWHLAWARKDGVGPGGYVWTNGLLAQDENIYVMGTALDWMTWGYGEPSAQWGLLNGDSPFLASYDATGSFRWMRAALHGSSQGFASVLGTDGSLAISGQIFDRAVFNEGLPDEAVVDCPEGYCGFVARYDTEGHFLSSWFSGHNVHVMAVDAAGQLWATVTFMGKFSIPMADGSTTVLESGDEDAAVVAFNLDGLASVVVPLSGDGENWAEVKVSADGNTVFLFGFYEGQQTLGVGTTGEVTLVSEAVSSQYLAAMSRRGEVLWARDVGPASSDSSLNKVNTLKLMKNGDLLALSRYRGRMDAGDADALEEVETSPKGRGLVLARYNDQGTLLWRRVLLASGFYSRIEDAVELADGSLAMVGTFPDELALGIGEEHETTLRSTVDVTAHMVPDQISWQGFVALFTPQGRLHWALKVGDTDPVKLPTIAVLPETSDQAERIVVAGSFLGRVLVGTGGGDGQRLEAEGMGWDTSCQMLLFALARDAAVIVPD